MRIEERLDSRLRLVAAFVREGAAVADIGTDHGYLVCALVEAGRCPAGWACDIRPQPLEKARALIEERGLGKRIETRLTDGLEGLPANEVDDVVVAGMGGESICGILERAEWLQDEQKHLILQPMSRAETLRRWLCENGYRIEEEAAAEVEGHFYAVMSVYYSGDRHSPDELYCYAGELPLCGSAAARGYLLKQEKLQRAVALGLRRGGRRDDALRHEVLADMLATEREGMRDGLL